MVTTLTEYQSPDELPVAVAFPPLVIDSLAAHLARLGKRQLHVAETEKYAHVTYFFNGGVEEPFPGEERILVPSNREVPTYDLAPEMSAGPITDALVEAHRPARARLHRRQLRERRHGRAYRRVVGGGRGARTSSTGASVACHGGARRGAAPVITADHGNIEEMRDESGDPQTKHTTSPVPFVLVVEEPAEARLRDGELADVAPTLLRAPRHPAWPGDDRPSPLTSAKLRRPWKPPYPDRADHPGDRAHRIDPAPAARTGLGGAFGGEVTAYRSRRGIERTLFRLTIVLAILFVAFSLLNLLPQA